MGAGEDLRTRAQWPRSTLSPLSRRPLRPTGSKLLGKTTNGTGDCPHYRPRCVRILGVRYSFRKFLVSPVGTWLFLLPFICALQRSDVKFLHFEERLRYACRSFLIFAVSISLMILGVICRDRPYLSLRQKWSESALAEDLREIQKSLAGL